MPGKNDQIEIKIEDIGNDGEGIGKYEGCTFFVKDAVIGDTIRAKIMKMKKNYGYAKLEEILIESPYRVTPKCEQAGRCGGCQLQHTSYEKQLEYKQNKVRGCLERIGGLKEVQMPPIIGMEYPYHYRNKALFPVGKDKNGTIMIGFYAGRTHSIIDTTSCCIQDPINESIVKTIRDYIEKYNISVYDEERHEGLVRHILTRVGFVTGEVMVGLVLNGEELPYSDILAELLREAVDGYGKEERKYSLAGLVINRNMEKTNVILGKEVKTIWGQPFILDYIGSLKYRISPLSFYQVNPRQTQILYETALNFANLSKQDVVWDLYCGIGTISLFVAQQAKQVYGVEIVPQAVEDARKNADLNGIDNAEFYVGAAEEVLPAMYMQNPESCANVIIVDPPRKGCDQVLLETIANMTPERVIYISCDPATLARDLKYLSGVGYALEKVQAVDMFGMVGHVECVVLMSRKDK